MTCRGIMDASKTQTCHAQKTFSSSLQFAFMEHSYKWINE